MSVAKYLNKIAIAHDKNTNTLKFIGVLVGMKEKDNGIESATLYLINEKKYVTVMNDDSTAVTFPYWGNYNVELLSTMKNFKGKIKVNNCAELNTLMHYFQGGYHVDNYKFPVNVYIEGKYIRHIAPIIIGIKIGIKDEFVNYPHFKMIEHFDTAGYTICPTNYDEHHDYATDYKITYAVDNIHTIYSSLGISNSSVEDSVTKVEAMNINNSSLKDFHKKYSNDIDLKDYIPQEFVNYCQADVDTTIDMYKQERISRLKSLIGKNVLIFDKNEELFIGLGVLDNVWKNYEDRWVCRVIYNSVDNNTTPTRGINFDTYYIDNISIIEHDWDLINFKNYIPNCLIHITDTYDYKVVYKLYYDVIPYIPEYQPEECWIYITNNKICNIYYDEYQCRNSITFKEIPIFEIHNGNVSPKVYNYNLKTNSFIEPIIVHADFANNTKEENKMKLNFKTVDGKRFESYGKHNGKEIETITTVVDFMKNGQYFNGEATIDAIKYDERQGILEALANAIYGNFDNEYDKYVKDKEHKEKELCRCKVCGKWYNEVEDKIIPFTAEDARKHEAWHIENKKAKRERQRIRKEAEKRVSEIKREQEIEKLVQQMLDSDSV